MCVLYLLCAMCEVAQLLQPRPQLRLQHSVCVCLRVCERARERARVRCRGGRGVCLGDAMVKKFDQNGQTF